MVCDGNGRMPPLVGPFDNVLRLGYPVHIAHLGMAVKLHPFAGAVVLAGVGKVGDFLDPRQGTDGKLVVKFIYGCNPFYLNKSAFFDPPGKLRHLVVVGKELDGHGVGKIRHIKHQYGSLVLDLTGIEADNLPTDDHLPHFSHDIFHEHGFFLKVTPINYVRVVRTLHPAP
ncbi:hypothetical protein IMSAGC019_00996 [Lachnospiraceae bacterium]|nr:hypothetical protein IMSAGC019_00996 [Lachnospiraceae bacterium]